MYIVHKYRISTNNTANGMLLLLYGNAWWCLSWRMKFELDVLNINLIFLNEIELNLYMYISLTFSATSLHLLVSSLFSLVRVKTSVAYTKLHYHLEALYILSRQIYLHRQFIQVDHHRHIFLWWCGVPDDDDSNKL